MFSALVSITYNSPTVNSLLTLALFYTALALHPNLNVLIVSSLLKGLGLAVTIKVVLLFPPKDS